MPKRRMARPRKRGAQQRIIPATPVAPAARTPVAPTPRTSIAPTPRVELPTPNARFTLAGAGLHVRPPSGWRVEHNEATVVYQASARIPSIVFFRAQGESRAAAVARLPALMSAEMKSVRMNRTRARATVARYPALQLEGTGRIEGFPVRWRAHIIEARERVVMVAVVPIIFWNQQQARIRSFIATVHRSHGARR